MKEKAAVFLKVRARYGLAPKVLGIEGRGPQNNVFAVERAVALANRHRRLPRVVPDRGEAIRFGIEAGDSRASALRSVRIEKGKIRLQKLAILDHVLLTRAFCHQRLPIHREERLDDVPVARKLREHPLTGTRRVRRFVLIVGLLRDRCNSNEPRRNSNGQRRGNAFLHGSRMICENRGRCKILRNSGIPLRSPRRSARHASGSSA